MFDSLIENKDKRGKRLSKLFGASIGVHGMALAVVLIVDQLRVGLVPEPAVTVTFVDFSSPPPPPPPPPPKKKSTPKKEQPKPVEKPREAPKEMVAPKEIPVEEPKEEEPEEDTGSDDGVEGGVEGGVAGGVVGGMAPAPPPKPPPPPPAPIFRDMELVRKGRIGGSEPRYPSTAMSRGITGTVVAKIVVGPDGRVKEISFMQSHPAFERTVREAVEQWVFNPVIVDGQPVSFYTVFRFVFRL